MPIIDIIYILLSLINNLILARTNSEGLTYDYTFDLDTKFNHKILIISIFIFLKISHLKFGPTLSRKILFHIIYPLMLGISRINNRQSLSR